MIMIYHTMTVYLSQRGPYVWSIICFCVVAKLYLTLLQPHDCSPPGFPVYGTSWARILEWVAISFSMNLPNPGIKPMSPALAGRLLLSHLGSP